MLDVLEADWEERSRLNEDSLEDCLLMSYLLDAGTSSSMIRRVVKSVLANGDVDASRAYPEVFDNETRDWTTSAGAKRKREFKVELEEDKYGDYVKNEEFGDDTLDSSQPQQSSQNLPALVNHISSQDMSSTVMLMGGPEAVVLRLRVLALVRTNLLISMIFEANNKKPALPCSIYLPRIMDRYRRIILYLLGSPQSSSSLVLFTLSLPFRKPTSSRRRALLPRSTAPPSPPTKRRSYATHG